MYTNNEIDIIKKYFPIGDIDSIVKLTGRTKEAIRVKANRIGVYLKPSLNLWHNKIPLQAKIYLAGHFDGEGCARFREKQSRLTRTPSISVNICNIETLNLYKEYFNGKISESKSGTNKKMYRWTICKYDDIYNFIMSVLPYSIEKKEQLILLKTFIDMVVENGKGLHFSEDFRFKATELHNKCTALKRL